MCGIAGIIDFGGNAIDERRLLAAQQAMVHRGPDDGAFVRESRGDWQVGLAAVRLAILDPTPVGAQPFRYGNRYLLAYNGEIYNFRELRRELAALGANFRTDTDTEVVAAACAQWGPEALTRFNGMWAFAFVDLERRGGFLVRDRFGIKPLLVACAGRHACFASEMMTLRALGDWPRDVDRSALLHYLSVGYFAAPDTVYEHVRRIGPGEYIAFDERELKAPVRYYDPTQASASREHLSYTEAGERVRHGLSMAVARRRIADVPLGAFLSGGLDSSIVALHLAECTPGPVKTFSIGYVDQPTYDETAFARMMADCLGSEHHELRLCYDDVIETLPAVLDHLGEPFFDSSILPTAVVSRLARQHVTACLSGDGGDELFGGYWRYLGHQSLAGYHALPALLRKWVIEPLVGGAPSAKSSLLANRLRQLRKLLRAAGGRAIDRHLAWSRILAPEAMSIVSATGELDTATQRMVGAYDELTGDLPSGDELNRILAFDLRYNLPGDMLHKVDLASMLHSLEVRVPFLDPEVVETALACPSAYKVSRGLRKRLLTDAYRGYLPDAVLDRPKMGFEVPVGEFLRSRLRDLFYDVVTRERIQSFGMLDYDAVQCVYDAHCRRQADHADLLFALLSLCWWRMRGG